MDRNFVKQALLAHRAELEQLGVEHVSVFGSVSRGDGARHSDIDIAVMLDPLRTPRGFSYISRLDAIEAKLRGMLGAPVDVIAEPARKPDIQAAIERDRFRVY